jgi:superoxide dismutase, Cu-Zn family
LVLVLSLACAGVGVTAGCGDDDAAPVPVDAGPDVTIEQDTSVPDTGPKDAAKPIRARAVLLATSLVDAGNVNGTVDFDDVGNGSIVVRLNVSGAREGSHGVHIHENGSCKDDDAGAAGAAGSHWNPDDAGHGLPDSPSHHPGDFGNVDVPFSGVGTKTLTVKGFAITKGAAGSAVGRAVIFHAGTDDGTTQPTGNSGGRAACGVIEER